MSQTVAFALLGVFFLCGMTLVFFFLFHFLRRQIKEEVQQTQQDFLKVVQQQLSFEQDKVKSDLESRKEMIESTVKGLEEELKEYRRLISDFEKDRADKYARLEQEIKTTSQNTMKLQETTSFLTNILGNVKLRGQWGERMAEDIIRYAGLIEGINYRRQKQLATRATKPDYTFLLPESHIINMDVKFPLDNYINMVNATGDDEKEKYFKDFSRNVRDRIKEIQNRDYINPAEQTLDFVLLFIPNEQVFSFIQENMPDLMDEAMKKKVVVCSPFTLYAMLSVIRQAYENFRYEKDMKKIIQLVEQFSKLYNRFKDRFEDIGRSLDKLNGVYADVRDKSFKQIDTKIRHIDDYKKGKGMAIQESKVVETLINEPKDDDVMV
ncbi:MAG: DNA recombination protein RmuC [Candidatus Omnitrophica bacterium]|nr:DNA recombination protein RmuC [Candidatus Omnitrophota bacterium]